MSRRIERGERASESVRRIVRREAQKALARLARRPPSDAAVHAARKHIKRARAALRLLREPLGDRRYGHENRALRDAAKPLGTVRNAQVLVRTLDGLVVASRRGGAIARIRDGLARGTFRARRRLLGNRKPLRSTRRSLASVRRHAREWRLERGSWRALGGGLDRVYRAGRTQLAELKTAPSDSSLHELRKQAKYLRQQLEILEPIAPAALRRLARTARQLADRLGEDHDLAMLKTRLRRSRGGAKHSELRRLLRKVERERDERRGPALALASRLYRERPARLSKRLEERWRSWRRA